jgi:hypothetical protein
LLSLVDAEVRERIEEAVDFVSLDVVVQRRRAHGLPPPAADNAGDRAEFEAGVVAFLERLTDDLAGALSREQRQGLHEHGPGDRIDRLIATQVALAKQLPDYWQRFETIRARHTEERGASGSERRGFLARLFRG